MCCILSSRAADYTPAAAAAVRRAHREPAAAHAATTLPPVAPTFLSVSAGCTHRAETSSGDSRGGVPPRDTDRNVCATAPRHAGAVSGMWDRGRRGGAGGVMAARRAAPAAPGGGEHRGGEGGQ